MCLQKCRIYVYKSKDIYIYIYICFHNFIIGSFLHYHFHWQLVVDAIAISNQWLITTSAELVTMPDGLCRRVTRQLLQEDNLRFVLHIFFMVIFSLLGALIFMALESGAEQASSHSFNEQFDDFLFANPQLNVSELNSLLRAYASAASTGMLNTSIPRWNFAGSLYYVGTLVSTIGI